MYYKTKIKTAATTEPITVQEVKSNSRISCSADDALIAGLITAATQSAEKFTGRSFMEQTWEMTMDEFPEDIIYLPHSPVKSITSIKYYDTTGTQQTLTDYQLDIISDPARIYHDIQGEWPTTHTDRMSAIEIIYIAGYAAVPQGIKQALLLTVGHWYEHREEVILGINPYQLPFGAESLMLQYQIAEV